jgi:DNA polymerase-3 subunit gamma/tau
MNLYNKYRPSTFEKVMGNDAVVSSLSKMLTNLTTCPHSFLLTGPTGCGKTTIGRIISNELGCKGSDLRENNTADFRGIDTVREIISNSSFKPLEGACRVWIIDECHKMTNDAQNALLKILEDTPNHVYFILCTTEPQKLLQTIKGRCQTFQLNVLSDDQMRILLRKIVREEKEMVEKEVFDQIVQDSLGHPRNAINILEQVLSVEPDLRLEIAKKTAERQSQSIELCRALIKRESWKKIIQILDGLKDQEAEDIRRVVLGYCQAILLKESNDFAARIIEEFWEPFYNVGFPGLVYSCYSITKN